MRDSSITVSSAATELAGWPQYKKFSSLSSRRVVASRIALACGIAAAFFVALRPDAQPPVSQSPRHVTLERVVIVAKREAPGTADASRMATNPQATPSSNSIKLTAHRN
jgi:hypothetical protein